MQFIKQRRIFCIFLFSCFMICNVIIASVTDNCKVVYTFGYGYQQFFHLANRNNTNSTELLFKFFVQARSDAHILLSTAPSPSDKDPVYEIVIGAGQNTFSDIRRLQREDTKSSVSTLNLLSPTESREFWIRISNRGMIQILQANNDMPFIFWQDPHPLYIRYYSFCTWPGVIGKWNYDCPENDTKKTANESVTVEPELTAMEKLRRDLFANYDSYSIPIYDQSFRIAINLRIKCWRISLDAHSSTISLSGIAILSWIDEKLTWEPDKYDDTRELNIGSFQTWRPEIILHNAVEYKSRPFKFGGTIIEADGKVNWIPVVEMVSRCEIDLINWPWDTHVCKIHLETWSHMAYFVVHNPASLIDTSNLTFDWIILDVNSKLVPIRGGMHLENSEDDSTAFEIKIKLRRNTSFYHAMFVVMFVVFSVMSLTPFLISPLSSRKILVYGFSIFFLTCFLLIIANSVPEFTKQTPTIVTTYNTMLFVITVCCALSVFLITLVRTAHSSIPPMPIVSALNNRCISAILYLPTKQDDTKYNKMCESEDDSGCSSSSMRKISKEFLINSDIDKYWLRLAVAIDHILFGIVSILMAYLLAKFTFNNYT